MSDKTQKMRQRYADMALAISLLDDYEDYTPQKVDRDTILREIADKDAEAMRHFQGQPLSRVFTQPRTARSNEWRIKYSGIHGFPR